MSRYLQFCECGAGVPVPWVRLKVGCGSDGRSCAKPRKLTPDEISRRQAQLQLEHELMWQAAGINMDAGELLERSRIGSGSEDLVMNGLAIEAQCDE